MPMGSLRLVIALPCGDGRPARLAGVRCLPGVVPTGARAGRETSDGLPNRIEHTVEGGVESDSSLAFFRTAGRTGAS